MKITVDTNVLISATFWYGSSNEIIEKVENKEIALILSKEIIEEFSNVLDYEEIQEKIKDKNLEMKKTVEKIVSISTIIEPTQKFTSRTFLIRVPITFLLFLLQIGQMPVLPFFFS